MSKMSILDKYPKNVYNKIEQWTIKLHKVCNKRPGHNETFLSLLLASRESRMRAILLAILLTILPTEFASGFEHPRYEVEDAPCNPCKRFVMFDYLPIPIERSKSNF